MDTIKINDTTLQGKDIVKELKKVLKKQKYTFGAIYYGKLTENETKKLEGIILHVAKHGFKYRAVYVLGSDNLLVFDKVNVKAKCKREVMSFKKINSTSYFIIFGKVMKIC